MSIIKHASSFAGRLARTVCGAALGLGLVVAAVPDLALAQDTPPAGPALWVVRDADSTLYLFGTVHLLRPGGDWMTPQVADAFDASEELWLEIEDPTDQAAAAPLIMQHGLSPQTPLSSRLNAEELASLDAAVAAMGATRQMLDPMLPWLAALTLSIAPLTQAGYDPAAGVDVVLRQHAVESGKPVHGLETIEQQLMFFAGMEPEVELDFLRSTLESFDESATLLDAMAGAWATGDVEAMYGLGGDEMKTDYPAIYDMMLTRRNADWVGQIQDELAGSGTVFIAVGALHLAGPDSVQAQLQAAGVTVERIQ